MHSRSAHLAFSQGLVLALGFHLEFGAYSAERTTDHIIVGLDPVYLQQAISTRADLPLGDKLGLPKRTHLRTRGGAQGRKLTAGSSFQFSGFCEAFLLDLPPELAPEEAVRLVRQSRSIRYAELDGIVTAASTIPNDPDFPLQWHHQNLATTNSVVPADIRSVEAWDFTRGSSNVLVAVLDTGCNTELSEFAGRMAPGYDFVNNDSDPSDDNGHGTEVTAVLAATGDNGALIAGVDWNCRILPVKVLGADRSGLFSTVADGVDYAVTKGAKVIVLSAGGLQSNITLSNSIAAALLQGVSVVAAAHNDGGPIRFPARMPGVIAVGATLMNDQRASFSNFGPELSVVAPGTNIYTLGRFGVPVYEWGTSVAAPQVGGALSLILALRPELRPEQLRELICAGADDRVGPDAEDIPGFDPYYGYGRLNIFQSIQMALLVPRIIRDVNGSTLIWQCSGNLALYKPYEIQSTDDLARHWVVVGGREEIVYREGEATWVESSQRGEKSRNQPDFTESGL